jgi:hypothetical protein
MIPPLLILLLFLMPAAAFAAERSSADAEVAFTYGVRAFNDNEMDEALRLFREALAADPHDGTARYWLGLTHLSRGEATDAVREIEASLKAKRPPEVDRVRVEADLRRARTAAAGPQTVAAPGYGGEVLAIRDQPRFDLRAGVFYGQDSNPMLLDEDTIAFLPGGTIFVGEVDDRVANFDLRAGFYPFYCRCGSDGRNGLSLGLTGEGSAARFSDLDFLDETRWRAAAHLAWGSDPLGYLTGPLGYTRVPFGHGRAALLLQAGTSRTDLDGDPLAEVDQAALTLVVRESVKTATQVELDVQKREFLDGRFETDLQSLSASQIFFLGRRERFVRVGLLVGEESGFGFDDADITTFAVRAELSLPFANRWILQVAGSNRKDEWSYDTGGNFDESSMQGTAALTWAATRHLYVVGRGSWVERDSDLTLASGLLGPRDYQRTSASLGVQWIF